jgi:hypothetical protein
VELGKEIDLGKTAFVISCSRENVGNKVFTADEPVAMKEIKDVEHRVVGILWSRWGIL